MYAAEKRKEQDTARSQEASPPRLNVLRLVVYFVSALLLVLTCIQWVNARQPSNKAEAYIWNQIGYCYLHGHSNTTNIVDLAWSDEVKDRQDILDDPVVKSHCKGVQFSQLAAKYFSKAADLGLADAQFNLGRLYRVGNGVRKSPKKAVKLFQKAAKQGHVYAQYNLGVRYSQGRDVVKSDEKAIYWYEKAAKQGLTIAQYNLAMVYLDETSVKRDYEKALEILWPLADSDAYAQNAIGLCYFHGNGMDQDYRSAMQWYIKAAKQGLCIAMYNVGVMYMQGYGVKQDLERAAAWIHKAAMENEVVAMKSMGDLYNEGWGVSRDTEAATEWWRRAAFVENIQAKKSRNRYTKTENAKEAMHMP